MESAGGSNPRLVDTQTKEVYQLSYGRQIIASHTYLLEHTKDPPPSPLILPPSTSSETYCCEVVLGEEGGCVTVLVGECQVNGEPARAGDRKKISNGAFINLGQSIQLQFTVSSVNSRKRRVLPQTPGKPIKHLPPSKPKRIQPQANSTVTSAIPLERSNSPAGLSGSGEGSLSTSLRDPGLRSRLQRISREVNERRTGYHNRKPPPPYEQVGNSIGFQLLLQNHKDVTSPLIDSLYAPLKELELKDPGISQRYSTFLQAYRESLEGGATHECMHPEDIPTLHFLTDVILHCCSMPQLIEVAKKHCPLWLHLVSVFSASGQNQLALVEQRSPSQILSCMHLGLMAESVSFQCHGWYTLAHVVGAPTLPGMKPALREPSVTLALALVEQQLEKFSSYPQLVGGVMYFLGQLATTVKACITAPPEGEPVTYNPEQAGRILGLLREHNILRHVMKVPQELRQDKNFDLNYCALVKALVPTRSRPKKKKDAAAAVTTPTTDAPIPPGTPPKKPKRLHRNIASRQSRQSRKIMQPPVRASSAEDLPDFAIESAPSLPQRHTPSPPTRWRSKSVDELDYDSDSSSHTHSITSLPDVLRSSEEVSVSQLREMMGNTVRLAARKGAGRPPGKGGSVEEKLAAMKGERVEEKLAATKGESVEEDKGDGKPSGGLPGEVSAEVAVEEAEKPAVHMDGGEESTRMATARVKVEVKPAAVGEEADRCEENSLGNQLNCESAAVHADKDRTEDTPPSSEPTGVPEMSLNKESSSQEVKGGVTSDGGTQGGVGKASAGCSTSTCTNEMQTTAPESSTPAGNKQETFNCSPNTDSRQDSPSPIPVIHPPPPSHVQHPSLSPLTSPSPPSTPDSLAGDIQSLLSQLRAPVSQGNINNNNSGSSIATAVGRSLHKVKAAAEGPTVLVPEVTRGSHYYRHSFKRRNRKAAPPTQSPPTQPPPTQPPPPRDGRRWSLELEEPPVVYRDSAHRLHPRTAHRMSWDPSTPLEPLAGQQESQFFEHSGEFLSKEHTALEDLSSGHEDVKDLLSGRLELLGTICKLWRRDKGLQAATNAITACFSGTSDISLFIDILTCFCAIQSPWTLAVSVVMLPVLRQLMGNQREERHLLTVCTALTMVVKRFSDIIQTAKNPKRSSRLSSRADQSQKEVCYRELHHSWLMVGERLDQGCDTPTVTGELTRLKALLEPYSLELDSR